MLAVMLAVLPPAITLPLHGVVQAGSNLGRAVTLHPHIRRSVIGWFSAGTLVGLVIGSRLFVSLSVELLSIILGVFILWTVWMPKPVNRPIADRRFFVVGALASFCTLFVGATGPMVAAFWNVAQMGKLGVVATHAASAGATSSTVRGLSDRSKPASPASGGGSNVAPVSSADRMRSTRNSRSPAAVWHQASRYQ